MIEVCEKVCASSWYRLLVPGLNLQKNCRQKRRLKSCKSGSGALKKFPYLYYDFLCIICYTSVVNTLSSLPAPDGETLIEKCIERGPYLTTTLTEKRKPQDKVGKRLISGR